MASTLHQLASLCALALLASAANAQDVSPDLQHGTSVGAQLAPLFDPPQPAICLGVNGPFNGSLSILKASPANADLPPPQGAKPSLYCAQFDTWIEHLGSEFAESVLGGFDDVQQTPSKTVIQRYVRDNLRLVYVMYAVTVEKLDQDSYRVSFADSTAEKPGALRPVGNWNIVAPPQYPRPQIVRENDEISLPLFIAGNGVRLVDYIRAGDATKLVRRTGSPRDSYADDSEFTVAAPHLRVNGNDAGTATVAGVNHGTLLWIYVPGLGRYELAYRKLPGQGFEWGGEVSGNKITLNSGGNILRIECAGRISAGGGSYNVYVRSDPAWQPPKSSDRSHFLLGVSSSTESAASN